MLFFLSIITILRLKVLCINNKVGQLIFFKYFAILTMSKTYLAPSDDLLESILSDFFFVTINLGGWGGEKKREWEGGKKEKQKTINPVMTLILIF